MDAVQKAETEARLRSLFREQTRFAEAYRSLPARDFGAVYPLVFGYIRSRFLLEPEMCPGEKLFDLADASLRRLLALKREGIEAGEIARSCAGASSVITKKILLFKAMEEDFSFSVTPEEFAGITTVTELTEHLLACGGETAAAIREHAVPACGAFAPEAVRGAFPALTETIHGHPLVYLDNAATSQMPRTVMDAVSRAELARGNVRRGVHTLSERSTALYEEARQVCADFLGALPAQITFTSGTTDGVNRAAEALDALPGGVIVTALEHHSNFVPWQQACRRLGRPFRVCPIRPDGSLDTDALEALLTPDISVLAVTHCSNVLGTVTPVRELCSLAHRRGVRVLVDGAQSVCHRDIDVSEIGCDWFVCSGHKLGGPFGIGLLYSREPLPPVRFGGGMVDRVTERNTSFAPAPQSGEAGTPNVSGAAGLAAAIRFRQALPAGWRDHEAALLRRAEALLREIPGVRVLGPTEKEGCLSFVTDGVNPLDAALLLDGEGVALRSGNHCAQPLMEALGLDYTLRLSPAYYNTAAEIDGFAAALRTVIARLRSLSEE
jgi:cysteine desulfurase/selenocysteine lyase